MRQTHLPSAFKKAQDRKEAEKGQRGVNPAQLQSLLGAIDSAEAESSLPHWGKGERRVLKESAWQKLLQIARQLRS